MTKKTKHPGRGSMLTDLPTSGETWEVGAYRLADLPGADDLQDDQLDPNEEAVVIVIGARETGSVLAGDVIQGDAAIVADRVAEACHAPAAGSPRRPGTLVVDRPELVQPLEMRFRGTDVRIVAADALPFAESLLDGMLRAFLEGGPNGDYADAGVSTETTRALFEAARDFDRAAPWTIIDADRPIEIRLPGLPAPRIAAVMGAQTMRGLALFADREGGHTHPENPEELTGSSLTVLFRPRSEAPDELVEQARREELELSSGAVPVALYTPPFDDPSDQPPSRFVNEAEARELVLAMRAIAAFCARHRQELLAGESVESAEPARTADGESAIVRIRALGLAELEEIGELEEPWADDEVGEHQTDPAESRPGGGFRPELDRIRELVTRLPEAREIVERLRWSFFRDEFPFYVGDDDKQIEKAQFRFLEWAMFGAAIPPDGRTLAQRAIEHARGLDESERRRLSTYSRVRYGAFEVEEVEVDVGMRLRDLSSGETLDVQERLGSRALRTGALMMGPLFPDGEDRWVLSAAMVSYPSMPTDLRESAEQTGSVGNGLALALEQTLYGASTRWIQEIEKPAELREAYDAFVQAMGGKRSGLPTLAAIQKRIRESDSPSAVLGVVGEHAWWTAEEAEIFAGFFQRVWNLTPRPELDGRSPDQVHRKERGGRKGKRPKR